MQRLYSKPLPNTNTVNISIIGMNGSGKSGDSYVKTDLIDGQEFTLNIQDTSDSDEIDLDDINKWSQAIIILFSMTSRRSFYRAQELIEALKQVSEQQVYRKSNGSSLSPHRSGSNLSASSQSTSGPNNVMNLQLSPGPVSSLRRAALYTINPIKPPTMILVANKLDLERFRLVEKREAETIAKVHGIPYFEVTVTQTYKEIQAVFHAAARLCIQPKQGKTRGTNGSLTSPGRGLLPGVGGGSSPNSVLSNLAVSPGLLLQKKTSSTSVADNPNIIDIEQTPSNGSSSILSNLRLTPTPNPPSILNSLLSSSPGPSTGSQSNQKSSPTNNKPAQPASISPSPTSQSIGSSNSTLPPKKSNVAAPTKIPLPNSDQTSSTSNRTTTPSQGSIKNPPAPTAEPPPLKAPAPAKAQTPAPPPPKRTMGFKFFSKRAK